VTHEIFYVEVLPNITKKLHDDPLPKKEVEVRNTLIKLQLVVKLFTVAR
jgi:hypothetical protein